MNAVKQAKDGLMECLAHNVMQALFPEEPLTLSNHRAYILTEAVEKLIDAKLATASPSDSDRQP